MNAKYIMCWSDDWKAPDLRAVFGISPGEFLSTFRFVWVLFINSILMWYHVWGIVSWIHVISCNSKKWKSKVRFLVESVNVTHGLPGLLAVQTGKRFVDSTEDKNSWNKMSTPGQGEKRYDPQDTTLKFVNRPDDLDPYRKRQNDFFLITSRSGFYYGACFADPN